jgi:hypothetical protein
MRPLLAAFLVLALLNGCAAPRAAIVGGAATMLAGGLLLSRSVSDPCATGQTGPDVACQAVSLGLASHAASFENDMIEAGGGLLLAAGAALAIAGFASLPKGESEKAPAAAALRPAAIVLVAPKPAPNPAIVALRSREQNRLAFQASTAAHIGQCGAAALTAQRLAELDAPLYQELLATDATLASCVAAERQRM